MFVHSPPNWRALLAELDTERALQAIEGMASPKAGAAGEYIHWDKLRHLTPPDGLTLHEWWLAIKMSRLSTFRPLPLADGEGNHFVYAITDEVMRLLHYVDQHCAGEIAMPEIVIADDQARQHYLVNSLMEEAIRSSQLEGATTSRAVAKELLRSGRMPRDRSERMILNNYLALQFMREEMDDKLTPKLIIELQRILTDGTLDNPEGAGRLQTPEDVRVAVYNRIDAQLIHRPPPAEQLPERLEMLCDFANTSQDSREFMHPAVRAILLHFWLAYDHPFEDGNGRTARALFYWSMRMQKFWLVEYLSISRILRDAPSQYSRAFVYTETDDRDATYFLLYHLRVIHRAIGELHKYLARKIEEVRNVERLMRDTAGFNHRQLALLSHALRHPEAVYSYSSHATSHNVTHETGRLDLLDLFRRGLLERRRAGRKHVFSAAPDLSEKLRR